MFPIDWDFLRRQKLMIVTPMYGGMCAGHYALSLALFSNAAAINGVNCIMSFRFNESLITRGRNDLAHEFMLSDATHLVMIDADIRFSSDDIFSMTSADKPIICGIYPKKEINWESVRATALSGASAAELEARSGRFVINHVGYADEAEAPIDEPLEVWSGGTGLMIVKREVFETLAPNVPVYKTDLNSSVEVRQFFDTSMGPEGFLLSEDYHFCNLWRAAGGRAYVAPWVHLGHVGTYTFNGSPVSNVKEDENLS